MLKISRQWLALLLVFMLPACQTQHPHTSAKTSPSFSVKTIPLFWSHLPVERSTVPPSSSSDLREKNFSSLIEKGACQPLSFSPSGSSLLLSCVFINQHQHSEIYLYSFQNRKLKRITHQDSDVIHGQFINETKILYSSQTDESKENSKHFIARLNQKFQTEKVTKEKKTHGPFLNSPLNEIYSMTTDGQGIQRLTKTSGYDGSPSFLPSKKRIYFTSQRNGSTDIYYMNEKGHRLVRVTKSKDYDGQVRVSEKSKKLLWIKHRPLSNETTIMTADLNGKNQMSLPLPEGFHWMPAWHPDGEWLIFSSNFHSLENFSIYAVKSDGRCLQRLTGKGRFDISPVFGPDGESFAFSRWHPDHLEVIHAEFHRPSACTEE